MAPKRGAKAAEPPPPKRGAKAAAEAPAPKRGAKAAAAEAPPKRGSAKAAEPPPPKRGAAKAAAKAAAEPEPAPAEDFDSWPVPKLQARLKEMGATSSGGKAALVARLKALSEAAPAAAKAPAKAEAEEEEEAEAPAAPAGGKRKAPEPKATPPAKQAKTAPQPKASRPPPASAEEPSSSQPSSSQQGPVTFEDGEFKADYAKSNRSECKKCKEKIDMGGLRLGKMVPSDRFDGKVPMWYHACCFLKQSTLPRSTDLISGFSTLRPEDQERIMQRVPPPGGSGEGDSAQDDAIKQQNLKVFEVHDVLSSMGLGAVKEMMELNGYPTQKLGVNTPLLDLAADGIVFGATGKCEACTDPKRPLLLSGEGYRCTGWVNEYLKCSFKTQTPPREVWQLTDAAKSAAGGKLKKMRLKTGDRLFASKLGDVDAEDGGVTATPAASTKLPLDNIEIAIIEGGKNMSKDELVEFIQKHGGTVAESMSKATTFAVSSEETANQEPEHDDVETAKEFEVPGVEDTFLTESVEKGALQDMTPYLLWGEARKLKRKIEETVTSRFIEKNGVSMDADVGELASKAHVLVEMSTKTVYSEMMNRTDLVSGGNAFYTLHLLEADDTDSPQYWLFRKWGRIGVSQGGTKVEEFGTNKSKAILNFKKQYEDKTGNEFGIGKDAFVVKPGKFIRLEMQHKVLTGGNKKAKTEGGTSEAGGGADQPLGQLSKAQIEKGDAVLDKIEAAINEGVDPKSPAGTAKFLGMSAEFYSLIPHNFGMNRPPTISNPDILGAERALLQFYMRMGFEDMDTGDTVLTPIAGVMEQPLPKTLEESAKNVCGAKDIKACDKKAVGLAKKQAGKPREVMEASQYGAILLYTANAIYQDLNKCLRDENRAKVERYFSYLRLLFEACRRLPQNKRTLWRGIGVDLSESYKVGSTIIWWGVSSCTSEKKVAQDFMKGVGDKATFLTIETQTACDISELSFYSNEAESILLPGTKLEVIKSEKMGKNASITLREVGRVVG